MTIGERIAKCRKDKNLTQEYVAEKLNVSRQAVSKWENDLSSPDTYNLIALSKLFGTTVEYLACGEVEPQPTPIKQPEREKHKSTTPTEKPKSCLVSGIGFCITSLGILLFIITFLLLWGDPISIASLSFYIIPVVLTIVGWKTMI